MNMIVFEDTSHSRLGPLAQTRPVFELRCGALSLVERQARCLGALSVQAFVRPELEALSRFTNPARPVNAPVSEGEVVLVNGRWLAPDSLAGGIPSAEVGVVAGELAWVRVPHGEGHDLTPSSLPWKLARWKEALPNRPAGGVMIEYPWDLIKHNAAALLDDERHWYTHRDARSTNGLIVQGPATRLLIDTAARVEPMAFFDTTNGPVMVDAGAVVKAFSRLEGPCYIGPNTQVMAARVVGSSVGPQCRLGGEVESTIIQGHSNKAHDGFLGHSYIGEWVNLGAGTQTSDLRNDYGKVSLTISGQKVETGELKAGSYIGDHTKASIGTLLNTGSVCGPFAMLVAGGGLLPRVIPAFSMVKGGHVTERTDLGQMFATARTMMGRRQVEWAEAHADFFLGLYERTSGERFRLARESERRIRRVV
jgi:UDP-N-acetylglucosamine diphosphorylase/glucosamine-1-phosphate N-acetyltransferase